MSAVAPALSPGLRHWPIGAGLLVLAVLWLSPLHSIAGRVFSAHMALHLGVVVVAAPLLGIGLKRWRSAVAGNQPRLIWAVIASVFEMLVVWGWHAPPLQQAASTTTTAFVAQQFSFLLAGVWLWWVSFSGTTRAAAGVGSLAMLLTFMHMTMLGVLIALAPELLYASEVYAGDRFPEQLRDQRIGGVLMAIAGAVPYLIGGLVLANRLLGEGGSSPD
ncbi:cytochrome c oxidase assembly protein [Marinobacter salicampi]|uniref:cytochrome c oxidase assembly protein n=1 Tax=Marinobacter salicampi TaxID=435907 RepID=UPI00140DA477|nr:cytochrome c oxidase assembly protein [Marinobacter salicampi]